MISPFSVIISRFLEKHDRALENKLHRQIEVSLTHELKTPLTCILAYSEMLMENLDSGLNKDYASMINGKSLELLRLIDNVITISILELNPQIIDLGIINIPDLVRESIIEFKKIHNARDYVVKSDMVDNAVIYGNDKLFKRMLLELLTNSYFYAKEIEKPDIHIKLLKSGRGIDLDITDNGIGIDGKYLNRIFDKFFRVGDIEKAKSPGLGIGLSLVKKITDLFNGEVEIKSKLNEGTSVCLHFPLFDPSLADGSKVNMTVNPLFG